MSSAKEKLLTTLKARKEHAKKGIKAAEKNLKDWRDRDKRLAADIKKLEEELKPQEEAEKPEAKPAEEAKPPEEETKSTPAKKPAPKGEAK